MRAPVADVHNHFVPAPLLHRLLSGDTLPPGLRISRQGDEFAVEIEQMRASGREHRRFRLVRAHYDVAWRLAEMDRLGVDVHVLSLLPYLFGYTLEPAAGAQWCLTVNEGLAGVAAGDPAHFRYLAALPMQDPHRAAQEMERTLSSAGACGVAIATHVMGTYLDDPQFLPFWEAANALSAWILLHPLDPVGHDRMRSYYLVNLVGNPVETALAGARLLLSGLLVRYPRVRLCLAHGGGALPILIGRIAHGARVRPELPVLDVGPMVMFRRLYFDTVTHDPEGLAFLVRTVGASHVCLGSDFPADMRDPDPVGTVRRAGGISEEERLTILRSRALMDGAEKAVDAGERGTI